MRDSPFPAKLMALPSKRMANEGDLMLNLRKVAVSAAAVSATVLGTMAGFGGVANAVTVANSQSVAGCSIGGSALLEAGVFPSCTAATATVVDPTSVEVTVDPTFIAELTKLTAARGLLSATSPLGVLLGGVVATTGVAGETVSYTLACSVNGGTVTKAETFTATGVAATQTQDVNLQDAVGSPEPNSCQVQDFTATSTLELTTAALAILNNRILGPTILGNLLSALDNNGTGDATLFATTAVPGAIYTQRSAGLGRTADICADDAGNGNAGSVIQAYQCNSDLAQFWTYTHNRELVRNGDCMAVDGSNKVVLRSCNGNTAQQWTVNGTATPNGTTASAFGTIVNRGSGDCLTATSTANFTQLTMATCTNAANQQWTGPARTKAGFGDTADDA